MFLKHIWYYGIPTYDRDKLFPEKPIELFTPQ